MITNIPTSTDFSEHAYLFLNLSWDRSIKMLLDYEIMTEATGPLDRDHKDDVIRASRSPLLVAQALAQQGAELALKSCIARVSPFLLISSPPSQWPKRCDQNDIYFSEFRTLDSQDLIKVYNTINSTRMDDKFYKNFDKYRKARNTIYHTVDANANTSEIDIIRYILQISELLSPRSWPKVRKTYRENTPENQLYMYEDDYNYLVKEFEILINILTRTELVRYFHYDKRNRRYICPHCYDNSNKDHFPPIPRTAQLIANGNKVRCFICDEVSEVSRIQCNEPDCKGNVIRIDDDRICLTCGEWQEEPKKGWPN